jgi:RimJ/RimL family protein N-acetyltransferase
VRLASTMTDGLTVLTTSRLRLVPATSAMITAELERPERLAEILDAAVPSDWPPSHHDVETLRFWRDALARPDAAGWWLHYAVVIDNSGRWALVGSVSYKGPPADGVVEIGYSVVRSWQRQGLATEACCALVESAWQRRAEVVIAHTHANLEPSIGVLASSGSPRRHRRSLTSARSRCAPATLVGASSSQGRSAVARRACTPCH